MIDSGSVFAYCPPTLSHNEIQKCITLGNSYTPNYTPRNNEPVSIKVFHEDDFLFSIVFNFIYSKDENFSFQKVFVNDTTISYTLNLAKPHSGLDPSRLAGTTNGGDIYITFSVTSEHIACVQLSYTIFLVGED